MKQNPQSDEVSSIGVTLIQKQDACINSTFMLEKDSITWVETIRMCCNGTYRIPQRLIVHNNFGQFYISVQLGFTHWNEVNFILQNSQRTQPDFQKTQNQQK